MKRKFTLAFIAMASAMMSSAYADGYENLIFKSFSGESYSVATQGLEFYFKDGNLSFNNDVRIIPAASLISMEFDGNTGSNTGLVSIPPANSCIITIYSVDGIKKGEFPSLSEACNNLQPGVYIAQKSNGETIKINVRQ